MKSVDHLDIRPAPFLCFDPHRHAALRTCVLPRGPLLQATLMELVSAGLHTDHLSISLLAILLSFGVTYLHHIQTNITDVILRRDMCDLDKRVELLLVNALVGSDYWDGCSIH